MTNNPLQNPIRSALMMLGASALFAITAILAKALGQGIGGAPLHPFQISAGRFGFAMLTILLVLAIKRPTFHKPAYKVHLLRSIAGWSGVTLMFTAVALIPVSDATAIGFLNPVVAMVLAAVFLREKVGRYRWLAAFIALIGAMILLRPGFGSFQIAAFFALAAAAFMGLEITIIKKLSGREAPLQILTINNIMGFAIAISVASFFWVSPTPYQWLMLSAIGVI
ncbi:MAG: drug/metabolite transporter (DMT)-like permease, partial [Paracoccaceae bacterium]